MQNEPEYELIKSSRKTLAAEIKQGRLIIRAPHQAADDDIRRFIQKNRQWIETHLAKSRSREAAAESFRSSDRKSTRLNSSHVALSRMPSSA